MRHAIAASLSIVLLAQSSFGQVHGVAVQAPSAGSLVVPGNLIPVVSQSLVFAPLSNTSLPVPAGVSGDVQPGALALPTENVLIDLPANALNAGAADVVADETAAVLPVFAKKIHALANSAAEAGKALQGPSSDDGQSAAARQFDVLTGEQRIQGGNEDFATMFNESFSKKKAKPLSRPSEDVLSQELISGVDLTEKQIQRVIKTNAALEKGIAAGVGTLIQSADTEVHSRGSTARMTQSDTNPDYDLQVHLPASWDAHASTAWMDKNLKALQQALERSVAREISSLFGNVKVRVVVEGLVPLSDPVTGKFVEGVFMLPLKVHNLAGSLLVDADVTFTNRPEYANAYPQYFEDQMAHVRQAAGERSAQRLLRDIRFAKRFFLAAVGSYKVWQGGPSGVGVEQMIMQSGRVQDGDLGRTVLEIGSFEKFIDRVLAAGIDEKGGIRALKSARKLWMIHNPFMKPANFLDLMSNGAFKRLVWAARKYRTSVQTGRPLTLEELYVLRKSYSTKSIGKDAAATAFKDIELRFIGEGNLRLARDLSAWGVQQLEKEGVATGHLHVSGILTESKDGRRRIHGDLRLQVGVDEDVEAVKSVLKDALRKADKDMEFSSEEAEASAQAGPKPVQVSAPAAIAAASKDVEVAEAVLEEPRAAVENVLPADDSVGRMTLEMLEKFTLTGPKPTQRGDAFLYAQGAKALPAELEASNSGRLPVSATDGRYDTQRVMLLRKNGDIYVLLKQPSGEKPLRLKVPPELTQGIVTDSLVDVAFDPETGIQALMPVGSYRADMIVGRVVAGKDGALRVEALFSKDPAKTLYAPMPLAKGASVKAEHILQVFVRKVGGSFEAVPLLDLGTAFTPEIAAREIALRRGARGYFDRAVIEQAEQVGRTQDPAADFNRMKEAKGRSEDMRALDFITIDPVGAGDLDDAYYIRKEADGGYTWYLATADVAQYVQPGTPAFKAAARIGNTFYSIDKEGVPEFPMNHPVVSKYVASLLAGKDSLAMVTKMRFGPDGTFLLDQSEVFLGLVNVKGRYTYDQVGALWQGKKDSGIAHLEQVSLARELASKLEQQDETRGKLVLSLQVVDHVQDADGRWRNFIVHEDPLVKESHRLIEELKVYGNRVIATRLNAIAEASKVPHISRMHPPKDEASNAKVHKQIMALGIDWPEKQTLPEFLQALNKRTDLSEDVREAAQILALYSRSSALYTTDDGEGHEGLALAAGEYDHPSTPIRRFSDMYNRALLETYLEGSDPQVVYEGVLKDLRAMGFKDLDEYLLHLNGRERAAKQMDYEIDDFMSAYELAKPENHKEFTGYVKMFKDGKFPTCTIQLRELPATITLHGKDAEPYALLDKVKVRVKGANLFSLKVDASIIKDGSVATGKETAKGKGKGKGKGDKAYPKNGQQKDPPKGNPAHHKGKGPGKYKGSSGVFSDSQLDDMGAVVGASQQYRPRKKHHR
ncbi:MAG: RNB domain-containing ribonuclease [Elusimicrobiota bacterium]|jgi:VacB/RNase II family 3'-5' exoribonuclease